MAKPDLWIDLSLITSRSKQDADFAAELAAAGIRNTSATTVQHSPLVWGKDEDGAELEASLRFLASIMTAQPLPRKAKHSCRVLLLTVFIYLHL